MGILAKLKYLRLRLSLSYLNSYSIDNGSTLAYEMSKVSMRPYEIKLQIVSIASRPRFIEGIIKF